MTAKSVETEIETLNIYRQQMANDIHDLKSDVKEIKEFLMGEEPKIVTKKEFDQFKASQTFNKVVVSTVTAVITAMVTYLVLKELGK